jgi:hypothetical protein
MKKIEEPVDISKVILGYKITPDTQPGFKYTTTSIYFLFEDTRCVFFLRRIINDILQYGIYRGAL